MLEFVKNSFCARFGIPGSGILHYRYTAYRVICPGCRNGDVMILLSITGKKRIYA